MKNLVVIFLIVLMIALCSYLFFFNPEGENISNEKNFEEIDIDYLKSYYSNKDDYEEAFEAVKCDDKKNIKAGIVSHHFLAKDMIAEFFACINPESVENIIIISPDHFDYLPNKRDSLMKTTLLDWDTPYGILHSNKPFIDDIKGNENITLDDTPFRTEHGVYTLIPFVQKVFPDAKVTPLILENRDYYDKYFEIGKNFDKENTILIASIDFAHHVNVEEANYYDQKSIQALKSFNMEEIDYIEADCNHCVAFLYGFLNEHSIDVNVLDNKTSKDFGWEEDNDLTSYISVYYKHVEK